MFTLESAVNNGVASVLISGVLMKTQNIFFILLNGILASNAFAEECKVAVLLPLTGDVAEYGAATMNAIQLFEDGNKQKMSPDSVVVQYSFKDNKFDATETVSAYRQAGNVDLIYNWGEPTTGSLAPIVQKEGKALLAMSVDARPSQNRKNVIRTLNSSDQFVSKGLDYLRQHQFKRFVVFMASDPFFEDQLIRLKEQLKPGEEIVKVYSHEPADNDFRASVTNARQQKFDAVFVYLFPAQSSTLVKQLRGQGLLQQIIGTDIFESKTVVDQAEGAMEGAVYVSLSVSDDFRSHYEKRYGNDIEIAYAYNAYKMAHVIQAMCNQPHKTQQQVLSGLITSAGAAPDLMFKETAEYGQYFESTLVLRRIERGRFVNVQ